MRDVTWRPTTRPARRRRGGATPESRHGHRKWIALAILVAVNLLVLWYHGDPRDYVARPDAPGATDESPPTSKQTPATPKPPASKAERAAAGASSVVLTSASSGIDPRTLAAFDPLLGLRTPGRVQRVASVVLAARQTAASALSSAGLRADEVAGALHSLAGIVDFRRLRPGHRFKARLDGGGGLLSLDLQQGAAERFRADREAAGWRAQKLEVRVDEVLAEVSGGVETSLWVSLVDELKESPELVHQIVDVFAWEIDFYSEVYPGDTFRVLVPKRYAEGQLVGYGAVLAAEFVSGGVKHRGYAHREAGDNAALPPAYYDENGRSMRKQLLKAPLKYGHVTSGFGSRRHPILGYTRAHNGIDYGVPTGTPVWSVGDGRVLRAGWNGGYGKLVEIRHANGWVSQYAHLSRIDVRPGAKVRQKEIVGAVGTTGMSTGPHLHYGLKKLDRYVNPLVQRFEPGQALAGKELLAFKAQVADLASRLDGIRLAMVNTP